MLNPLEKAQVVENYHVATKMISDLPPERFTRCLASFANDEMLKDPHSCGAAGCLGGWIAHHPHFQQYGVYPDKDDGAITHPNTMFPCEISDFLFGNSTMFCAVLSHEEQMTEKEVCLHRLHTGLALLG